MTGVSLLIGNGLVLNWYYWKKIKLDIPRFWREIIPIFIVPLFMTIVFMAVGSYVNWYNIWTLMTGIIIYIIIFGTLNWLLILNNYEKSLFISPLKAVCLKYKPKA